MNSCPRFLISSSFLLTYTVVILEQPFDVLDDLGQGSAYYSLRYKFGLLPVFIWLTGKE